MKSWVNWGQRERWSMEHSEVELIVGQGAQAVLVLMALHLVTEGANAVPDHSWLAQGKSEYWLGDPTSRASRELSSRAG